MSRRGVPPTALSRFAASARWSISSTKTPLTTSTAAGLRSGSNEYSAVKYGGSVACSSSIAHCRCSRRLPSVPIRGSGNVVTRPRAVLQHLDRVAQPPQSDLLALDVRRVVQPLGDRLPHLLLRVAGLGDDQ